LASLGLASLDFAWLALPWLRLAWLCLVSLGLASLVIHLQSTKLLKGFHKTFSPRFHVVPGKRF